MKKKIILNINIKNINKMIQNYNIRKKLKIKLKTTKKNKKNNDN